MAAIEVHRGLDSDIDKPRSGRRHCILRFNLFWSSRSLALFSEARDLAGSFQADSVVGLKLYDKSSSSFPVSQPAKFALLVSPSTSANHAAA